MRKFIQCAQNQNENVSIIDTIKAIKNAGFDGVFVQWYDKDWAVSQQEQVDLCRSLGLEIEFAHLGYTNTNSLWYDDNLGDITTQNYIENLVDMKKNNINLVVMHLSVGKDFPPKTEIGLVRFSKIIKAAEELGIRIAFENTRGHGYLEYLFENIKSDNIGVCLDTGHYHCHFKDQFNWELFKDKIWALHTHDNDSSYDQHLLPFDGTIDWKDTFEKIKKSGYDGPITLESCYEESYLDMSLDDFYKESYNRAKTVNDIFESIAD